MDAELTLRFTKLEEEDKRLICVVLNNQCLEKQDNETLKKLSDAGKIWLIDYETQLLTTG